VNKGIVTLTGRRIGSCQLLYRLGSVHQSKAGYHRDITLILFSKGRWNVALQLAQAFSAGTFDARRLKVIAQVMVTNYNQVRQLVYHGHEEKFAPSFATSLQFNVWSDLMLLLSQYIMDPMNSGISYLARISRIFAEFSVSMLTIIVLDDRTPQGLLEAVDFNAVTGQQRRIFMVTERPHGLSSATTVNPTTSLHKAGTTVPISGGYDMALGMLPLESFDIGGTQCGVCQDMKALPPPSSTPQPLSVKKRPLRRLRRRELALVRYLMYCSAPLASERKRLVSRRLMKHRKWRYIIGLLSSTS
jgi:hypothetical protein